MISSSSVLYRSDVWEESVGGLARRLLCVTACAGLRGRGSDTVATGSSIKPRERGSGLHCARK